MTIENDTHETQSDTPAWKMWAGAGAFIAALYAIGYILN
ncbi:hypothetical protein N177_2516 [Lutibaculum baratangense AMV1]|uniref:Uncharacterized protein n=1 Tax=Lutibaculum baratangense AMV1 TaxID=631454 RepID=V4QWF1_9HYPH|nr:hypothetical protein N177_2516 [Lutibaculum baratangense AMV1]